MDLEDLIEGTVNSIALIFFILGIIVSYLIYKRKKTATNLIQILLLIAGFFYSLGEIFEAFTTWNKADDFGDFFIIFLSVIILVVGVTAYFEHRLRESEQKLSILNKNLEQEVEERTRDLRASEENYRNLVNNILDVIFELNLDKRISYISPQIIDLCRYHPEEIIENKISEFIHSEDLETVKLSLNHTFKTGDNSLIECRMRQKDGEYIQVSIRGSLVKINGDIKIIGVIRNITDQKRAEKMIKEQLEKLKEIDQIRRDFVRRTSHELKTPLISLYSSSQYLLDSYGELTKPEILRTIKIINRGGDRLKKLTENLLAVYDIESKKYELLKQKENLTELIKDCTNDMESFLKERDLFLKLEMKNDFFIDVDKIKIEQVILNLLSNAIKNTPPKGFIYVGLQKKDDYIEIIIRDTGIGFTEAEKEIAFKKFGKLERQVKGKEIITEGSGLGLYISKEIVKLHKGKIWLESEGRNKGSTFIIRLPISEK